MNVVNRLPYCQKVLIWRLEDFIQTLLIQCILGFPLSQVLHPRWQSLANQLLQGREKDIGDADVFSSNGARQIDAVLAKYRAKGYDVEAFDWAFYFYEQVRTYGT